MALNQKKSYLNTGNSAVKSYTDPPSYQNQGDRLPLLDSGGGLTGLGGGPGAANGQNNAQFTSSIANPGSAAQPPGAGTVNQSSVPYQDYLQNYLGEVFGSGRSFEPMAQQITGQRDDALRAMSEKMASRGLGNSGAMAMGAGDIYGKAADQLSSAYQDWRSQGIQEMKGAISPYVDLQNAKEMMSLSTGEKQKLMQAQSDILRKQMFGEDYDPNQGTAEYELFSALASKGTPDLETQEYLSRWLNGQLPGGTEDPITDEEKQRRWAYSFFNKPYEERR